MMHCFDAVTLKLGDVHMNTTLFSVARAICLTLLLALSCTSEAQQSTATPAPAHAAAASWGKHGMVVFGGKTVLFASHMPMFHAPHDLQVVIQFHLADARVHDELAQALINKSQFWSLDPEDFDLQRLSPAHARPLTKFSADFFEGHFERGGQQRYLGQTVIVDKVMMFRRLKLENKSKTQGHYHVIGQGKERFLVKEIDRRPDFDVIFKLNEFTKPNLPKIIKLPTTSLAFPEASSLKKPLLSAKNTHRSPGVVLYFETEDLR